MGTSRSSNGSPSGVPLVPPWVENPKQTDEQNPGEGESKLGEVITPQSTPVLAPAGRFRGTRTSLGGFASSGSRNDLRKGVGRYVRSGLGGAKLAGGRFGGTSRTASRLYGALSGGPAGERGDGIDALDPAKLSGLSGKELIGAVIEAVAPIDGTQDTEASREAINDALSEVIERHPDADLLKLTEEQREFAIERFVASDVYRRFVLDVGNAIRDKAPNASTALSRLKEARDYIVEVVSGGFRKLRDAGTRLSSTRVASVVRSALSNALTVFEEYAE